MPAAVSIYIEGGSVKVTGTSFSGNSATVGGGIFEWWRDFQRDGQHAAYADGHYCFRQQPTPMSAE